MTLNECRRELRSIISELRDIQNGIRYDFDGIGNDKCADCIDRVTDRYDYALRTLNNVDYNRIADWVIKE